MKTYIGGDLVTSFARFSEDSAEGMEKVFLKTNVLSESDIYEDGEGILIKFISSS